VRALAATVVAVLLGGCGGTSAPPRSERLVRGQKIFASECSGCHTVSGREHGAVGGDLLLTHLGAKDLASFARVMPTTRPLSPAAAAAVASYIVSRER
jgi:mono/diheme cytochrome c family protein